VAQALGVVDVLVAGQSPEDGLPQKTDKGMPAIPPRARIGEDIARAMALRPRASSSSRYASNPASEVMREPWNSSFTRRSKSSLREPSPASPVGFAITTSLIPDQTTGYTI
jgi:hypothetical protein